MTDSLGYARVSTGGQDVPGQAIATSDLAARRAIRTL